jgi:hypothetical protein
MMGRRGPVFSWYYWKRSDAAMMFVVMEEEC